MMKYTGWPGAEIREMSPRRPNKKTLNDNPYLDENHTKRLHNELDIPENEVPIALVAVGIPPASFDVARSVRVNYQSITKFHQK